MKKNTDLNDLNAIIIFTVGICIVVVVLSLLGIYPYNAITHSPPYKNYEDYCYNTLGYLGYGALEKCILGCIKDGCDLNGYKKIEVKR